MSYVVVVIIGVALVFDYINGFHDAANSIATVVSTRVLTPNQAVAWAAFFNFAAFIFFGTKVAETIASVTVPGTFDNAAIFAALIGRDRLGPDHVVPGCRPPRRTRSSAGSPARPWRRSGWSALVASEYQKIARVHRDRRRHGVPARRSRS